MKAYTDIEQSKKLAEILPIKSADMHYIIVGSKEEPKHIVGLDKYIGILPSIPCWSLAALLDVLPTYLFEFDRGIDLNVYPNLNGRGWHCSYMPNCIENMKTDKFKMITSEDTLIDACYEMIIKLHELKLL